MPHNWAGMKYGMILAGFLGGIVSLAFVTRLNVWGRVMAVGVGMISAVYLTPIVVMGAEYFFDISSTIQFENGIAFMIGMTGMNILAGVYFISAKLRDNPLWIIEKLRGK